MMAQLLLSALFLGSGVIAFATIASSVRGALPSLRALRANLAAGDPVQEIRWTVMTVDVGSQPSKVSVLPVRQRVARPRQQTWLAAAA
jgi:hypothetical protein